MTAAFSRFIGRVFSRDKTMTIIEMSAMGGALKPNQDLENAEVYCEVPHADNLVAAKKQLLCSSGHKLMDITDEKWPKTLEIFDKPISALAISSSGTLAIGLDGWGIIFFGGNRKGDSICGDGAESISCPTAVQFIDDDVLLVANGSSKYTASEWKYDLMSKGCSGSVHSIDLRSSTSRLIAEGLAFPFGLASAREGGFYLVESWSKRVLRMSSHGVEAESVLDEIPGYPGRIIPAESGGYWLSVFAPQSQLIEFVLMDKQNQFRQRMMEEVPSKYWIAPDLNSGCSFMKPIQAGYVKRMGITKPWAPTQSYGLVILFNSMLEPIRSHHSRADGTVHGIVSICEWQGNLLAASKASGRIVQLPIGDEQWQ